MKLNLNFIGKVKRKSEFEKYYTVICVIIINSRVLKDKRSKRKMCSLLLSAALVENLNQRLGMKGSLTLCNFIRHKKCDVEIKSAEFINLSRLKLVLDSAHVN